MLDKINTPTRFSSEQVAAMNKAVEESITLIATECRLVVVHQFPDGKTITQGLKYDPEAAPKEWFKGKIEGAWEDMGK